MRRFFLVSIIISLLLLPVFNSLAASNLNLSKSNVNILVYDSDVVSSTQAATILSELESITQQGQARVNLKEVVNQLLKKHGLMTQIKKVIILPADATHSRTRIFLLANPADEAQAIAVSDPGMPAEPAEKPTKGKNTN
jgi:hypothetical protein